MTLSSCGVQGVSLFSFILVYFRLFSFILVYLLLTPVVLSTCSIGSCKFSWIRLPHSWPGERKKRKKKG
jgi:hypothetical protein